MPRRSNPYHQRDAVLRTMGFRSYVAYLRSPLWRYIRAGVMLAHARRCVLCPRRARVVHHLSYARVVLTGADTTKLAPLCNGCHKRVELGQGGRKRTFFEALDTFNEMALNRVRGEVRREQQEATGYDFGTRTRRRRGRGRSITFPPGNI